MRIDSKFFPLLRRGHGRPNIVKETKNGRKLVCAAEGCDGEERHRFAHSSQAAYEWADERGLKPNVDVRIN